ncbi:type II toxin-antitoxin system MqsA family antitoxin [Sodalis sp. dw_96]|uniref:type II toxin-antitoxin system MqsA family antitoxin n=1 Tax=Sodalis sp. dw_96 TaxID=2719794 RepID=UPI001BD5F568|nr:type II toxin-antitoxin system MqsA family antitoxin [Sodalis sp. dw_96]
MTACTICNSEDFLVLNEMEIISYKDKEINVFSEYTQCQHCGNEFISKEQGRRNDLNFKDAKRKADGLMNPDEIKRARIKLGLTQADAAKFFGGGYNAFSKYERGEVTQSVAMDKLIRLCLVDKNNLQYLRSKSETGAQINDTDFLLSTRNPKGDSGNWLKVK